MSSPVIPSVGSLSTPELLRLLDEVGAELTVRGDEPVFVSERVEAMVALDAARSRFDAVAAGWALAFEQVDGPAEVGCASLAHWMRRDLRVTPAESRRRVKAARALRQLAGAREALAAGVIGSAHVDVLATAAHLLGPEVVADAEPVLLEVARTCDADALKAAVAKVRDVLDPDAAEATYVRSLERRDVTLTQAGDGYLLRGWLDPEAGAAVKTVLYSTAKPTGPADDRTAGQRRVDGLADLCRAALAHGLPSDRGLRPHLYITTTADRLRTATASHRTGPPDPADPAEPAAQLHGHGPIPDLLLARLACDADLTPVVLADELDTDGAAAVLNVGRTRRLATLKQRHAIQVAQGGTCANPGCDRTHLEIHHLIPWSQGGPTDQANLAGYCTRCHHLIHAGLLIVTVEPDGRRTHQTKHARRLPQHQRLARHRIQHYLRSRINPKR